MFRHKVGRADDIVPGPRQILNSIGGRRLAGRDGTRRRPAFERGDPLFQNIRRRVHNAGVNIAELRQAEQVRGMFG